MSAAAFTVRTTTPRYDRLSNKLHKSHRDFDAAERARQPSYPKIPTTGRDRITSRNWKTHARAPVSTPNRNVLICAK